MRRRRRRRRQRAAASAAHERDARRHGGCRHAATPAAAAAAAAASSRRAARGSGCRARAAAAAQPTAVWLADGGLVANDDGDRAARGARPVAQPSDYAVISLGTGSMSPLGADVGDPSRSRIGRAVRALGGPSARYYRINPSAPGISMIDCNEPS